MPAVIVEVLAASVPPRISVRFVVLVAPVNATKQLPWVTDSSDSSQTRWIVVRCALTSPETQVGQAADIRCQGFAPVEKSVKYEERFGIDPFSKAGVCFLRAATGFKIGSAFGMTTSCLSSFNFSSPFSFLTSTSTISTSSSGAVAGHLSLHLVPFLLFPYLHPHAPLVHDKADGTTPILSKYFVPLSSMVVTNRIILRRTRHIHPVPSGYVETGNNWP